MTDDIKQRIVEAIEATDCACATVTAIMNALGATITSQKRNHHDPPSDRETFKVFVYEGDDIRPTHTQFYAVEDSLSALLERIEEA